MSDNRNNYTVQCIGCESKTELTMHAHRGACERGLPLVGWFFVCEACEPKFIGKILNWTLEDAP